MVAEAAPPILEARDLHFRFRDRPVLSGIDLSFHHGEIVALLGANGAGKSTLLRLLLGFERPRQGEILLDGRPLAHWSRREIARRVAYVPQSHVCPFPYSVRDVVTMGRIGQAGLFGRPSAADHAAADAELERIGIPHLAARSYTEISGGERQLTLLCRALVQGARCLLLDEPASALDFGHQARLLATLRRLAAEGHAVIMTTHHPDHALRGADRAVLLRDGRIIADGPAEATLTEAAIRTLYGLAADAPVWRPHASL